MKVVPNFSAVNVYWLSSGYKEDEAVATLLRQLEGSLRYGHTLPEGPRREARKF